MPRRLRVLLSAFACKPFYGTEPEVGWQWALQMARFHDVTVLTQAIHREPIEKGLQELRGRQPEPRFIYHALPLWMERLRKFPWGLRVCYFFWQRSAREVVARLCREQSFDLLHHVTFATYRYRTAIWGHGVPCIWGPVGGIESIPVNLLPWRHPFSLIHEVIRNAHNRLQALPFHVLPRRAAASTLILASTREMQQTFRSLGFAAEVMPTIGLRTAQLPSQPRHPSTGPLKLLFVGNIITLKGIDLALEALKASQTDATFALVGTGSYLAAARRLLQKLGLQSRVIFLGRLPREEVLKIYGDYDLFVFPSLHDTGGYAVIEAMFNQLPVICLDCGGPAVAVGEHCGVRVPLRDRAAVIADLAAAFRRYDQDRAALASDGRAAREAILHRYEWDVKGPQMDECYQAVVSRRSASKGTADRRPESSVPEALGKTDPA